MAIKVYDSEIAGVKGIGPDVFKDARRYFCETYNAVASAEFIVGADIRQKDNHRPYIHRETDR